jgi:Flp pilus assembly protein TadG
MRPSIPRFAVSAAAGQSRLISERSGATAVEFALIAAPTLLTLVGIFALGLNALMVASLDRAVLATARAISTGMVSSTAMSAASLKTNIVCPALLSTMDCNSVFLKVTTLAAGSYPSTYYSMVNATRSGLIRPVLNGNPNPYCPGAGAQYIVVELAYPALLFANVLSTTSSAIYNGQAIAVIVAAATFKSEPFVGAASYAGC